MHISNLVKLTDNSRISIGKNMDVVRLVVYFFEQYLLFFECASALIKKL